jgi:hypothetical protein
MTVVEAVAIALLRAQLVEYIFATREGALIQCYRRYEGTAHVNALNAKMPTMVLFRRDDSLAGLGYF